MILFCWVCGFLKWGVWANDVFYIGVGSYSWASEALSDKTVADEIKNWGSGKGFFVSFGKAECLEC